MNCFNFCQFLACNTLSRNKHEWLCFYLAVWFFDPYAKSNNGSPTCICIICLYSILYLFVYINIIELPIYPFYIFYILSDYVTITTAPGKIRPSPSLTSSFVRISSTWSQWGKDIKYKLIPEDLKYWMTLLKWCKSWLTSMAFSNNMI